MRKFKSACLLIPPIPLPTTAAVYDLEPGTYLLSHW